MYGGKGKAKRPRRTPTPNPSPGGREFATRAHHCYRKPPPCREGVGGGCTTMAVKRLTGVARKLRHDMTDAERRLWSHLRASQLCGAKFTRQFPIGNYVVDFACRSLRIAIECDGGQHSESMTDEARTRAIGAHGYHVVRFWNNEVLGNTDGVLIRIAEEIALARNET